jgi:hypothetical protein
MKSLIKSVFWAICLVTLMAGAAAASGPPLPGNTTQSECEGTVGTLVCQTRCTVENNYNNTRNTASGIVYAAIAANAPIVIQLTGMTNPIDTWAYGTARAAIATYGPGAIQPFVPSENPARPQPC